MTTENAKAIIQQCAMMDLEIPDMLTLLKDQEEIIISDNVIELGDIADCNVPAVIEFLEAYPF